MYVTLPATLNGVFYANVRVDQGVLGERTDTYNSVLKDACDCRVSIQLDMLYSYSAHYDFQMHFMHHKCKHLASSDVVVLIGL